MSCVNFLAYGANWASAELLESQYASGSIVSNRAFVLIATKLK